MERYGLFGKIVAQPGQCDALVEILLQASQLVAQAQGCEQYIIHTSPTEPDAIWVSEIWRSEVDHDASLSIAGVPELIAKARPMIASFGERFVTTPLGGKGLE